MRNMNDLKNGGANNEVHGDVYWKTVSLQRSGFKIFQDGSRAPRGSEDVRSMVHSQGGYLPRQMT